MGRSLAPIAAATRGATPDGSTTFEADGGRFTVEYQGGRMVHREARIDEQGRVLAQVEAGRARAEFATLIGLYPRLRESLERWFADERNRLATDVD
jgi:hypothetical protein